MLSGISVCRNDISLDLFETEDLIPLAVHLGALGVLLLWPPLPDTLGQRGETLQRATRR